MSNERPALAELGLGSGKQARLHRILFDHGAGNGTAMFLPYDQGLEHGPRDFFANPAASSPRYVIDLALEGGFNGVVLQIGLAEKFYWEYAGEIPLVLKLNGKTEIPSGRQRALAAQRDRRGGGPSRGRCRRLHALRRHARRRRPTSSSTARSGPTPHHFGMPLIVWAYPRGSAIEAKGGKDSFYAVDYAARTASELGADVVKLNFPQPEKNVEVPGAYTGHSPARRRSTPSYAPRTGPWCSISGGSRAGDDAMLEKARESMEAGATGLIFGRNVWQRAHDESLRFASALRDDPGEASEPGAVTLMFQVAHPRTGWSGSRHGGRDALGRGLRRRPGRARRSRTSARSAPVPLWWRSAASTTSRSARTIPSPNRTRSSCRTPRCCTWCLSSPV